MTTFSSCFLLSVYLSSVAHGFNIDVEHPLIFQGNSGAAFGYTSGMLKNINGLWLVVGSPKDNFTDRPEIISPGNVYKCPINLNTTEQPRCDVITLRTEEDTHPFSTSRYEESRELLGGSLVIAGNTIVVCAPLWKDVSNAESSGQEFPVGYCFQLDSSFDSSRIQNRPFRPQDLDGFSDQLLTGFSSSISQLPTYEIVMGMPGVSRDIGGIVLCDADAVGDFQVFYKPFRGIQSTLISDNFKTNTGSYIGYSLASGNFGPSSQQPLVVTGAPHYSNANGHIGSVLLLSVDTVSEFMNPVKILQGDQVGSYFGASLLIADVNGDDIDDLLIGSPQYHVTTAVIDQGKVDVYHGTADGNYILKKATLLGLGKPNSRFGTAMASLGDVTGDNTNDIIVGAPFEDGVGSVYIFNGGRGGINTAFSQRISGKTIKPGLKSFGWYISRSLDLDNNLHEDIAIGAHLSDTVIILRSRPVASVFVNISAMPNVIPLNGNTSECTGPEEKPCLTIKMCYQYTARGLHNGLFVDYILTSDAIRLQNRRSSRIDLYLEGDVTNHDSVLQHRVKIPFNSAICKRIFGRVKTLRGDFFAIIEQEVMFLLNVSLSQSQLLGGLTLIMNINSQNNVTTTAMFQRECQGICSPDLNIDMTSNSELIVGGNTEHTVLMEFSNTGDISYATSLYVNTTNNTEILGIQLLDKSAQITCLTRSNTTLWSELNCSLDGPFRRRQKVLFSLRLNVSLNLILPSNKLEDLEPNIRVFGNIRPVATGSIENNMEDNRQTLHIPIKIKTELQINGGSQPEQRKIAKTNFQLSHMYEIYNKGPSPMPETTAEFLVPLETLSGALLVDQSNIKVKRNGVGVTCERMSNYQSNTSNTEVTMTTTAQTSTISSKQTSSSVQQRTTTNVTCDQLRQCAKVKCSVPEIAARGTVTFTLEFTVKEDNLEFKSTDFDLNYHTTAIVYQPYNEMMLAWSSNKISYQTFTKFFPETVAPVSSKINIGVIIGGCVGAVVGLVVLGIILWRCGFFKREKQKEAQELKRKSMAIQKRRTQMMLDANRGESAASGDALNSARVLSENNAKPDQSDQDKSTTNLVNNELYPNLNI